MAGMYPGLEGLTGYDPNLVLNIGTGTQQAEQQMTALKDAQQAELSRMQMGQGLLSTLIDVQRDPFSIVPALQAYQGAGGGTLGSATALAASGGRGQPSPYGRLASNLMANLGAFSGGADINPHTGQPYSPGELAYLRQTQAVNEPGSFTPAGYTGASAVPSLSAIPAPGYSPIWGGRVPNPNYGHVPFTPPNPQYAGITAGMPQPDSLYSGSLLNNNLQGMARDMKTLRSTTTLQRRTR